MLGPAFNVSVVTNKIPNKDATERNLFVIFIVESLRCELWSNAHFTELDMARSFNVPDLGNSLSCRYCLRYKGMP